MKRTIRARPGTGGFTLVEMMSATGVAAILFLVVVAAFAQQNRAYHNHQMINEMQQNVRFGLETVTRDILMAGYGLQVLPTRLDDWVSWVPNFTTNPMIADGGSGVPDTLTIAAAFDEPLADLKMASTKGSTTITVTPRNGASVADLFNLTEKKVIFIANMETVRITAINGDVLTVSTHPTLGRGLQYDHPSGAPVELIKTIEYQWFSGANRPFPFLGRIDNTKSYRLFANSTESDLAKVTAAHVEDFQVQRNGDTVQFSLTGRVAKRDLAYTHPDKNDNFRRTTLSAEVRPRNQSSI